jgi:hypothetical protein
MRVLQGFDRILGRESAHKQRILGIGCQVDGSGFNPLNILGGATASVHFHNKFNVLHFLYPFGQESDQVGGLFCWGRVQARKRLATLQARRF